jgi:hypothetical protein
MSPAAGPAVLDHLLRLREQGWRGLLPILPPRAEPAPWLDDNQAEEIRKAAGKGPGRYVGDGYWSALGNWRAYPDDEVTLTTWGAWPGVNIGLRACHAGSGVVFLDADVTHPAAAGEVMAEIRRTIGRASGSPGGLDALVRIGRAPKALFPVRVRGSLRKLRSTVVLIDGQRCMLEVLAEGQQAVIGGIHPGTGQPYAWPLGGLEDIGPENLPELAAGEIGELVDRVSAILLRYGSAVGRNRSRLLRENAGGPRPLEELRARKPELALDAAHFVRNHDWARDDWVAWAYALRGAFGDEGGKLWLDFTAQSDKHHSAATACKIWADATRAEEEGRLCSGAGTILKIAADEGWKPSPRIVEGPAAHYQGEEAAPGEAADQLRTLLERTIRQALAWTEAAGEPPQTGIKTPAGLGKTTAVLDILAALSTVSGLDFGRQPEVWLFVPTVALALEAAARAHERGLTVQVIRGREAVVDGEPLCRKHEEAAIVAKAGLPVMETLCRKRHKDGTEMRCQFHDTCRYLQQFDATGPALRIFVHEYLFLPAPKGLPKPDLIVIDEAFALRAARHTSFGIDRLTTPRTGMRAEHEAEIHDVACKVRDALEKGDDPRAIADTDTFSRALERESTVDGEQFVWPSMLWVEQKRRLARLRKSERFKLCALWRLLRDQAGRSGPLQQIELRRSEPVPGGEAQDRVHVWWRATPRLPQVPVILLDASLDERLAPKLFPEITVESIAARRNTEVIQVSDTACSRNRLLSFEGAPESEQNRAANRLEDVRRLAEVEAASGRRVLLVTYKAAEEQLGSIPGVDVTHFGALRGLDRYKDHDTIIVAGRQQPSSAEVEDLARSLFGDDDEPLNLSGSFTTEIRGYRLRDGNRRGVQVAVYADPRCQAILEQIRERETEQAIDRLRLIHREEPARVILTSNLVVDVTVDRLVTWRELIPDRLTVAAARLDGVLPLAPAWLTESFSDLWETAKAAKHEVQQMAKRAETPNRILYLGNRPFSVAFYRLPGQRGRPSQALIVKDHPAPETALAALVGSLVSFRWAAEPPPPEASAGPVWAEHLLECEDMPEPPSSDLMNPKTWDPAQGVIHDPGEPPLFGFRGGSDLPSPYVIAGLFKIGHRLVVDVFQPAPPPPGSQAKAA